MWPQPCREAVAGLNCPTPTNSARPQWLQGSAHHWQALFQSFWLPMASAICSCHLPAPLGSVLAMPGLCLGTQPMHHSMAWHQPLLAAGQTPAQLQPCTGLAVLGKVWNGKKQEPGEGGSASICCLVCRSLKQHKVLLGFGGGGRKHDRK